MKACFALLISLLFLNCSKPETNSSLPDKYYPERNPSNDLQLAVNMASESGKRILLKVGGEWCIWCHQLDDFIHENKELNEALNQHYVILKINFSPENKNEDFLAQYPKIDGYPHIFVLESDGTLLHSQNTGELEQGKGYDFDKVMSFIETWKPNS